MQNTIPGFDTQKSEAFAQRVMDAYNGGALAVLASIGHRAGLFDAMASLPPANSARIAEAAELEERYVREWLGAMVTGGWIDYEPADGSYRLPPEHAAWLTRAATPDNLAVVSQYVGMMGTVEDRVLECFKGGGGVPYSEFRRFHEIMAEDSGQTVLPALVESILPLAEGIHDRLSAGIDVLDVGCGSGRALQTLARRFPQSRFTGCDISPEAIERASDAARRAGLDNVRFEVRDVAALDDAGRFDLVTAFDAIHDQAEPATVLAGIARALREDGVFLMQDIDTSCHVHENVEHPLGPFLYAMSTMHCMTVSLAAGGAGLGTCWGVQTAERMLRDAGFRSVEVHRLPHDVMNCFYVCRLTTTPG